MGWAGRAGWAVWAGGPRAGLGGWLARVGVGGGGEGLWAVGLEWGWDLFPHI